MEAWRKVEQAEQVERAEEKKTKCSTRSRRGQYKGECGVVLPESKGRRHE
jgi:hypothetical protein